MSDALARTSATQYAVGNPGRSAWVSANAGTGKTYVLVRRVIRQLLAGAKPGAIVCITFTKAGAAEMADRLMTMLGEWALMDDASLSEAIGGVTGAVPPAEELGEARRLFARALESPGGLKVQTIHSFCTSILGRFPVEAGVPVGFRGIEDDEAQRLLKEAVRTLAKEASDPSHVIHEDFVAVTSELQARVDDQGFQRVTLEDALASYARLTRGLVDLPADPEEVTAGIQEACGADDRSRAELVQDCWAEKDDKLLSEIATTFADAPKTAGKMGQAVAEALDEGAETFLSGSLFTQAGEFRSWRVAKGARDMIANFDERWEQFGAFIEAYRAAIQRRSIYELNLHFYWIARYTLHVYAARKKAELALDYDDLVERTLGLLRETEAAWVQFKLDEGIDHVLLDEAQDTSHIQWDLFAQLVGELTSSDAEAAGADRQRSLFVVGDPKQSIYAFQGADASLFNHNREAYKDRLGDRLEDGRLFLSFRTSGAVLRGVDAVFDRDDFRAVSGGYEPHATAKDDRPGSFEVWPHWPEPEKADVDQWHRPVDAAAEESVDRRVALEIARDIERKIADGLRLASAGGRAVQPSDFMVLFQRRGVRFRETIKALSEMGVACAGTDRIAIKDDTAVRDLLALLRFTANRDDSLSLAVLLKSPIFGWNDDDLMDLCIDRDRQVLWAELQRRGQDGHGPSRFAADALRAVTNEGMRHGPYRLLTAFLDGGGARTGHAKNHQRLGERYREAVESFLDEAMAYEDNHPRSVHGFLIHAEKITRDIKRETAGDEVTGVRVMTVHGAKGLEAPIVYCADADYLKKASDNFQNEIFVRAPLGETSLPIMVKGRSADIPEPLTSLRADLEDRRLEEYQRLFYVAATRAEEHLIICGGKEPKEGAPATWHDLTVKAFAQLRGLDGASVEDAPWGGKILRYAEDFAIDESDGPDLAATAPAPTPDWVNVVPVEEEANPVIYPSLLPAAEEETRGQARALSPELGDARLRGLLVHKLLELLPEHPAEEQDALAAQIAAMEAGLSEDARKSAVRDALGLLRAPETAAIFGPGSRPEVSIQGQLDGKTFSGQIDRLLIEPGRIVAVEFKSSRWVPETDADIPVAHRRQLETYVRLLEAMAPDAAVEGKLIYTAGPVSFGIS